MVGARGRPAKKPKFDEKTAQELEIMSKELNTRSDGLVDLLEFKLEALKTDLVEAYNRDVQNFCEENQEVTNMLLIDYLTKLSQPEPQNEYQIKEEPLDAEENLIPDVIHIKNKAFRHARPNEVVFSVNGTPITMEQPKTLIRNFTAVTQMTEVLTQSARSLVTAAEEFSEVD